MLHSTNILLESFCSKGVCVCVYVLWVAPVKIWGSFWVFVATQGLYLVAAGFGRQGGGAILHPGAWTSH